MVYGSKIRHLLAIQIPKKARGFAPSKRCFLRTNVTKVKKMYADSAELNIYSLSSPVYDAYIKGRKHKKSRPPHHQKTEGRPRFTRPKGA